MEWATYGFIGEGDQLGYSLKTGSLPSDFSLQRSYRPNVVILQVGGNNVDTYKQTVQTISIAGALDQLAMRLLNKFGVSSVYIGEIFTRKRPTNISPENYATKRTETMCYLTTMVQHEPRIRLVSQKNFGSEQEMFVRDGVHVSSLGQRRFYRSLRLALKTAVDQL